MPNKLYIQRTAKNYLQQVEDLSQQIEEELKLKPNPQLTLDKFKQKDFNYWNKYNKARTTEKRLFYMLLDDLLNILPEQEIKNGRPPIPLRDLIFCACLKLYNGFSARRISSDLDHAHKMGFIKKVPHFNSLLTFMKEDSTYEILQYLITLSAMPVSCMETDFAMDASGFGSYQYERWIRVRFGKNSKRGWRNYVKLHISCGTNTQIITAAQVTYGNQSDHNQLPFLAQRTSNNFNAKKYLADKAYNSRKNFEVIEKLNALPFIPFKKNAVGKSRGSPLWGAMFEYFNNNPEGFKHYYRQRAQSESVFSRIKRNFGEFLKSKTFEAQKNEVLLKCLCHNINVLIHQINEQNLKIDFDFESKNIVTKTNEFCT